jgi:Icc-related predicted phosphoesterase
MHTYEKNIRFTQSKSTQVKLDIRLVCMSDLHHITHDFPVPDGDVLIIAGDVCGYGTRKELEIFDDFLSRQGHAYKLLIAGNHDWPYARLPLEEAKGLVKNAVYLQDTGVEICGLKFWGSPWQPWFLDWAFNLPRGPQLAEIWAKIPDDIDVLITHTPPYGILDQLISGKHVGCADLANALARVRPKLHVFGHIHEGYGCVERNGTIYVNASVRNFRYQLVNPPIVIDV